MKVFICGQIKTWPTWEFQGVFSSQEKADKACINEHYFYFGADLDAEICEESMEAPGVIYPRVK